MRNLQSVEFDQGWVGGDREPGDGGLEVGGVQHGALHRVVLQGGDVGEGGDDLVGHNQRPQILPDLQKTSHKIAQTQPA